MSVVRSLTVAALLGTVVAGADVLSIARQTNTVHVTLSDGVAEIMWLSPSSVRVRQTWRDQTPRTPQREERVTFSIADREDSIRLATRELTVEVLKKPFRLLFRTPEGILILDQKTEAAKEHDQVKLEFRHDPEERLFGRKTESRQPLLLLSSGGYGLYFPWDYRHRYERGGSRRDHLLIEVLGASRVDYCFYYGVGMKETLEQHHNAWPAELEFRRVDVAFPAPLDKPSYAGLMEGPWNSVLSRVLNASLSGVSVPAINTSWLSDLAGRQRDHAEMLAALMPIVVAPDGFALNEKAQRLRRSLEPHLLTYFAEARDRGLPVIHPLVMQFPQDKEAARTDDQFLLGDELLAAPISGNTNRRYVYLPQGIWTELRSNRLLRGKRRIEVSGYEDDIPLFVRNGCILPLQRDGLMELRYFPKLGAEYFLWEPEIAEVTQVHAGPAADELRLEIEERAGRTYEWVIHNVRRPVRAEAAGVRYIEAASRAELAPGRWLYDETRRNLHVQARVQPGEDWISNIGFPDDAWFAFQ